MGALRLKRSRALPKGDTACWVHARRLACVLRAAKSWWGLKERSVPLLSATAGRGRWCSAFVPPREPCPAQGSCVRLVLRARQTRVPLALTCHPSTRCAPSCPGPGLGTSEWKESPCTARDSPFLCPLCSGLGKTHQVL